MLNKEQIEKLNAFKHLCLKNAEDAIKGADLLQQNQLNHLAFHMALLSLEEVAKVFMSWQQETQTDKEDRGQLSIPLDHHVKKIFWAIFFPMLGTEKFTKELWNETKQLASSFHKLRLSSIYTELNDTKPSIEKLDAKSVADVIEYAKARLELAKVDRDFVEGSTANAEDLDWFRNTLGDDRKAGFIFSDEAQQQLIDGGDVKEWVKWLKEYFTKQDQLLTDLAEKELNKKKSSEEIQTDPKWKVKILINTPSHSIRQNELTKFNKNNKSIQLNKGKDNHTLLVECLFGEAVHVNELWQFGWHFVQAYVAGLNIATPGVFYWHMPADKDKFYENIFDLENNQQLQLTLASGLGINWTERAMVLKEFDLNVAMIVQSHIISFNDRAKFTPIAFYLRGLAMLAKSDIHLRMDNDIFFAFFQSFKQAAIQNEPTEKDKSVDLIKVGEIVMAQMIKDFENYKRIIQQGKLMLQNPASIQAPIPMSDILLMKQYAGFYLLTLACRNASGNSSLLLTLD